MDFDFHMIAKLAGLGRDTMRAQEFNETIHERLGDIGQGGIYKRWAATFARIGIEGELGYNNGFPFNIQHREVGLALLILEDAQVGGLFGKESDLLLPIAMTDAQKNKQTFSYLGNGLPFDGDTCLGYSLD